MPVPFIIYFLRGRHNFLISQGLSPCYYLYYHFFIFFDNIFVRGYYVCTPTIRYANEKYYFYTIHFSTYWYYGKYHTYDSPTILSNLLHNRLRTLPHYHLNHLYEFNSGWVHLISHGLDIYIKPKFDSSTADEEKSKLEPDANPA